MRAARTVLASTLPAAIGFLLLLVSSCGTATELADTGPVDTRPVDTDPLDRDGATAPSDGAAPSDASAPGDAAPAMDASAEAATSDAGDGAGCSSGSLGGIGIPAGTTVSSSADWTTEVASHAIDGDLVTRWTPGASTGWLRLDFAAPVHVTGIRVAASGGSVESYAITSDGASVGGGMRMVPSIASDSLPRQALDPFALTPRDDTNLTLSIDGGTAWVELAEIALLTDACP